MGDNFKMKAGSLFAGIGGFDLGFQWAGIETVWQVEKDEFCQKVLAKHWPESKRYGDIYGFIEEIKREKVEPVDIIAGGFPCQPFSQAGKRKGQGDDRYLWPAMVEVISLLRPAWVVGENVAGILNMGFENMLSELESQGYRTESFIIPACAVNAPHRRDRVWIVAHTDSHAPDTGCFRPQEHEKQTAGCEQYNKDAPDTRHQRLQGSKRAGTHEKRQAAHGPAPERNSAWDEPWIEAATRFCGIHDGVPNRAHRLRALGNAVVPQIPYIIGKYIKEIILK